MDNETSLDDILSDDEPVIEQPQETGQARDEHGRFTAPETGEPQETAPQEGTPPSEPEQSHIPIAALKDERAKRQALEERLQQYDAYFAQQQQQGQQPQTEEDPIAFIAQEVMKQLQPQTEMQMLTLKVNTAEEFARQKWSDYDEKVELFKEAARTNPYLVEELKRAPNPAEYAYNVSRQIAEARQYGTATPSREELKAQLMEELKAELGLNKPQVPTSMVNEQSRGSRGGPAWSGPTSLDQILG